MANEEKELYKFVNNPKYREKIITKIHNDADYEYEKNVKRIESERNKLSKARTNEISRIANSRWVDICGRKLQVNRTEGKIRINGSQCLFSSIRGAELNVLYGCRVVTTETGKSKKHASLGGAIAGGLIFGPVGAVAGGVGLGKTKSKGTSVSNQIPTCTHLGVLVNIDGFTSEIVLISSQVDQSSFTFSKAQSDAQTIIAQLSALARTAVPQSFLKPEEESSVRNIDAQIESKNSELERALADKPHYALPSIYRTHEQQEMSDSEYLQYLQETDAQRTAEREANQAAFKNADYLGTIKKIGTIIFNIIFWILFVLDLIFAIASFTDSGVLSGLLFVITALLSNPKIDELISDKLFKIPKWAIVFIWFIGTFAGIMTFPTVA